MDFLKENRHAAKLEFGQFRENKENYSAKYKI